MSQTTNSTAVPYCTQAEFVVWHDPNAIVELLADGESIPPVTDIDGTTPNSASGQKVTKFLLEASGEVETAATVGKRYSPDDLASLTGAGKIRLSKLVGDLAFWRLMQRRRPVSADPRQVPGAIEALELLAKIESGAMIFPTVESQSAGLPDSVTSSDPTIGPQIVIGAARLFGRHGQGRW